MREATFLSQNEEKWKKVEQVLDKNIQIPSEEMANLFVELSDDLAFSQTHYPKSVTTQYLNSLSIGIYQKVTRTRKLSWRSAFKFWSHDIPLAMAHNINSLLLVFLFFSACVLIGAVSTHFDETFPRVVLGDHYVETTLENIEKGDPMAIYKSRSSGTMFFGITINNISVAAKAFAMGIFASIGSLFILFQNGIMLGTFQYFFVTKGLFWESFLSIWIHGTIEISSIVIAGTGGVVLGRGFLFPGSYTRKESFVRHAKQAFKIFTGTIPLFVIAGFLESYITRLTDSPLAFKLFIILGSLALIVGYFVVLPLKLLKNSTN